MNNYGEYFEYMLRRAGEESEEVAEAALSPPEEIPGPSAPKIARVQIEVEEAAADPVIVLALQEEWQWLKEDRDGKTKGDPFGTIKPGNPGEWRRYVPADWPTDKLPYVQFRARMESDERSFMIICSKCLSAETFIRKCRVFQFKKLNVYRSNAKGQKEWWLRFTKNNNHFLPGPFIPKNLKASAEQGMLEFNREAKIGYLGPGTFPCNQSSCIICDLKGDRTTKTSILKVGEAVQEFTKRYDCNAKDVFYIITCIRCENNGIWACHVGSAEELRGDQGRINKHQCHPTKEENQKLVSSIVNKKDPEAQKLARRQALKDLADGIIANGSDPDGRLRDSHLHFGYFSPHTYEDMRITVLQEKKYVVGDMVHAERELKKHFKSDRIYDPNGNLTGPYGLNKVGTAAAGE